MHAHALTHVCCCLGCSLSLLAGGQSFSQEDINMARKGLCYFSVLLPHVIRCI